MEVMRTIPVVIPDDPDVFETVRAFQMVTQSVSHRAFEMMTRGDVETVTRDGVETVTRDGGAAAAGHRPPTLGQGPPPGAVALHRRCYGDVGGLVNAQMTASAIRRVAGAYGAAWVKGHRPRRAYAFRAPLALWLIGNRGRDASLAPGETRSLWTLSLWTVAGRRRLPCRVPGHFQDQLAHAVRVNSLTVTADPADTDLSDLAWDDDDGGGDDGGGDDGGGDDDRREDDRGENDDRLGGPGGGPGDRVRGGPAGGAGRVRRLRAWLTVTVTAPDAAGHSPVGLDRGVNNRLVAVDAADRVLILGGHGTSARNELTRRVQERVREKGAARKAAGRDTRSVRRLLERLGRKQHDRNREFARRAALALCRWAPPGAVFVFEDLRLPAARPARRDQTRGRLPGWSHGLLRECVETKAEEWGIRVVSVNPAYTSRDCSQCGARGRRRGEAFRCPVCGHAENSDINGARNVRNAHRPNDTGGDR